MPAFKLREYLWVREPFYSATDGGPQHTVISHEAADTLMGVALTSASFCLSIYIARLVGLNLHQHPCEGGCNFLFPS